MPVSNSAGSFSNFLVLRLMLILPVMLKRLFSYLFRALLAILLYYSPDVYSQNNNPHAADMVFDFAMAADLAGDTSYDVRFYYPDLEISLDTPFISGNVGYIMASAIDGLDRVKLDLDNVFTVENVTGAASGFDFQDQVLTVYLSQNYNMGDTFSFAVQYHGIPDLAGGYKGLRYENHDGNQLVIASLSTPFLAHTWWPCKDGPGDKPDSLYIDITIRDTVIAGIPVTAVSNGMLEGIETLGNKKKFKWRHRYPVVPYYVMVAISNYVSFSDEYTNGDDSFPLTYYVFNSSLEESINGTSGLPGVFDFFIDIFGPYPFAEEKYGMTQLGFYGGIENQTNSIVNKMTVGWFGTTVHELSHMWFADMITCENWHHGWLNEGFASYATGLWYEHAQGEDSFRDYMEGRKYFDEGTVYLQDDTDPFNIFVPIIYNKGAWVLHMLRGVLGDEMFFDGIYAYATDPELEYGHANTEQFRDVMEAVSGTDLDYFFNQWIYEERYPVYRYNYDYNADEGQLSVAIHQIQQENGWLPVFTMPVKIRIDFIDATDSLVTVFNDQQMQNFQIPVGKEVTGLAFDPGEWILKESQFDPDIPVTVNEYSLSQVTIYPNPAGDVFYLEPDDKISGRVEITIFDSNGQLVFRKKIRINGRERIEINHGIKSPGMYYVELSTNNGKKSIKLEIR